MAPQNAAQELRRVEQQAEHPLLRAHTQVEQGVAGAVDQLLQARVGDRALVVEEGHLGAAALRHVTVDEERRRVEPRGHLDHQRFRDGLRPPAAFLPALGLAALGPAAGRFAAAADAGLTAIASTSTSSSGSTSRLTTSSVLGG